MSVPNLLGPISTQDSFMMVSIQDNKPFILDGAPLGDGVIYFWNDGGATGIDPFSKLPIFNANGTIGELQLSDTINGGGLGFRSDNITLGNAQSPASIKWSQSQYANWQPPDVLLSMPIYTIFNATGTTGTILTEPQGNAKTILADNIIILPVTWYSNCTSDGKYDTITDPIDSIINWFCLANPGSTGCTGSYLESGWTNLPDCQDGKQYTYCPVGDICGNGNCKGPCPEIFQDCDLGNNNSYSCVINPEKWFFESDWWKSPYFIGAVIGIIVLIIAIIFIAFIVYRHGKKVTGDSTGLQEPNGYESFTI